MGCIDLVQCVLVLRCGLTGVVWYPDTTPPQPNHKLTPTLETVSVYYEVETEFLNMV